MSFRELTCVLGFQVGQLNRIHRCMDEPMTEPPMTLSIWTKCTHTQETEESTFDSVRQHSSVGNLKKRNTNSWLNTHSTRPQLGFVILTFIQGQWWSIRLKWYKGNSHKINFLACDRLNELSITYRIQRLQIPERTGWGQHKIVYWKM